MWRILGIVFLGMWINSLGLLGQVQSNADSLLIIDLATIPITTLRIPTPPRRQPFSIATYQAGSLKANLQQLSLQEYLNEVPGLFSQNANNYAQDLRIAIRGFGARAAFGIRGIKIIVDGIPETTPDGQGQIDNLLVGSIDRIEILKGPSAALYGNASGGIINIKTKESFPRNFIQAGLTVGSFNMQQYQLSGRFAKKNTQLFIQSAHTRSNGFRQQSELENTNANLRIYHKLSEKAVLRIQLNYTNSPVGDDPGSLNLDDVTADRQQARGRNVTFQTGEAIAQFKTGANFNYQINENESLQFYGFYNHRNFTGRLPFEFGGWVDLQRNYGGQGGFYNWKKPLPNGLVEFRAGYDLAGQTDARQRYQNLEGQRGELTLDQSEQFSNVAVFALNHWQINKWLFVAGLRFDWNELTIADKKLDDGDQSGTRYLSALNPSIGINYEVSNRLHLYANVRTGFETPALSELSANPTGQAGFNESLESQQSINYELGWKGLVFKKLDFDLTLFYITTQNDLVPYELAAFPDRSFFRNAGKTKRQGAELLARYRFTPSLFAKASYTYSQLEYEEYALPQGDFSGNLLPGIPQHLASFSLNYENKNGWNARLQHRFVDQFFADDANTVASPAYHLTNLNIGYRFKIKKTLCSPFFGWNNIFNTEYFDNIRLNAFGGRYYEAAPGVNVYGGVRLRF